MRKGFSWNRQLRSLTIDLPSYDIRHIYKEEDFSHLKKI